MENEIWKDIPGYEGLYEVSNYGQIRSIKRLEKCGNKTRIRKERILKQSLRRGYLFVSLCKKGEKENVVIHRIVALLFIHNPNNMPEVDHIDGNKINNKVSNLRWVTAKQNSNNLKAPNTYIGKKLNKGGKAVLQFDLSGNFIKEWVTAMEVERSLGFRRSSISNCCNGVLKTAFGFKWKYK